VRTDIDQSNHGRHRKAAPDDATHFVGASFRSSGRSNRSGSRRNPRDHSSPGARPASCGGVAEKQRREGKASRGHAAENPPAALGKRDGVLRG